MRDPLPKFISQHDSTELNEEESAMKTTLEQVTPSKKKT
jgi:hypothetical protein